MNKPYLDYLRLATWDTAQYASLLAKLYAKDVYKPAKWLQYRGKRSVDGSIFHGMGIQGRGENERRHTVVEFSGSESHVWRKECASWSTFYCTRLDVQVTIEEPAGHDAERLYKKLHRKTKSIIISPGVCTVYVGSRRSDLFTRIYEKPINNKRYLRCEFELKGKYSKAAWMSYQQSDTTIAQIFATCHERAKIPSPWREWFTVDADAYPNLLKLEETENLRARLAYLHDTETALERMFMEHDTRGAVNGMIERLEMMRQSTRD